MLYHNIKYSLYDLRFLELWSIQQWNIALTLNLFQKKQHHLLMSHVWNFLTLVSMYKVVHMNNNIQQVHIMFACVSSIWKYIVHLKKIRSSSKDTSYSHMMFSRILRFIAYSPPETPYTLENVLKIAPEYAFPFIIQLLKLIVHIRFLIYLYAYTT